ncbi:MAG: PD40 domain-containing protein [Thermoleophilia bacterium]|nr:PD40 domain-containing protein [Thermoleophilia bacterium]
MSVATPPRPPQPDDLEAIIREARRRQRLRRLRIALAAVVLVALAVVVFLVISSRDQRGGLSLGEPVSAPARAGYEIALARTVTGNPPRREVLTVDAEGRRARILAAGGALIGARAAWSPDGERLAFTAVTGRPHEDDSRELTDIVLVDSDGRNRRRVTRTGRAFAPVWSPDGRAIIFGEREPGRRFPPRVGLWAIGAGGSDRRRLTEAEALHLDVPSSVSPDGSKLAFTRLDWRAPGPGGRDRRSPRVLLLDLRTLDVETLEEQAADPAYSPDGRQIAFVSDRDRNGELSYGDVAQYANELYVMDAGGGNARRLTRTRNLTEWAPSWSPDGRLMAFQRGEQTGNAEAGLVLLIRSDGSCARRLAFDPGHSVWYEAPAFRPGRPAGGIRSCRPSRPAQPLPVDPAGNFTVERARRFGAFGLYWVGRRFEGFGLSSISQRRSTGPRGRQPVVDLDYGRFAIQLWHACSRMPADVHPTARAKRSVRIRGVRGVLFEGGHHLEIVTGRTTVVIFGPRAQITRVAGALRPLNPAFTPRVRAENLPPPAPGAAAGRLACP